MLPITISFGNRKPVEIAEVGHLLMGIVIFNEREGGDGYDGPFWLYRESDLSRMSLTITSHGPLLVANYREDDSVKLCAVSW